jgi:hypothetical protein
MLQSCGKLAFMRLRKTFIASLLAPVALAGCLTYGAGDVGSMSTYAICELQAEQAPNLTPESKRLLASEVARRQESCSAHAPAIAARRAENYYRWTYGNESP